MAQIQIGTFTVTITAAIVSEGTVNRTSPASVVAGTNNVTLNLQLKDGFGNLVSGSYTITVKDGEWFNAPVDFVDGIATITFDVTVAGIYANIPVAVVIV
jgi:hypothetical protein